ncbi:uncharacterized protein TNIN_235311 [Trichonephila inaurata madagascariensis]|uniref:Uncharacterized protein n=1 Tax=Trichonephila inaurata madagascariensis TaxID=2747483 RepID=A0A8X6WNB1_9ARAC|nr:uncharacterized protein TNIN_235311 [Trichonephila inaurata madagascariensis]
MYRSNVAYKPSTLGRLETGQLILEPQDNTDFSTVVGMSKGLLLYTAYKLYFHGPRSAERHNLMLCDSFVLTILVTYSGFLIFEASYPLSLKHGVPRLHLVDYGSIRSQSSALVSSVLGLRFHVQQHHLRQGELRLRCESTLAREILRRREEVIFEGRHETAELQVAQVANSVSANSMKCDCSISILLTLLLLLHPVYRMPAIINAT